MDFFNFNPINIDIIFKYIIQSTFYKKCNFTMYPVYNHTGPLYNYYQIKTESFDITRAEDLISRKDYEEIITCSSIFWQLFCIEASKLDSDRVHFSVKLTAKTITLSGDDIKDVQTAVEQIRGFYVDGFSQKRNFLILPMKIYRLNEWYFKRDADVIDLKLISNRTTFSIHPGLLIKIILPVLTGLSESVGAKFSTIQLEKKCIGDSFNEHTYQTVTALKIDWIATEHFIYSIPPRADIQPLLYLMYKDRQDLCDLTLEAFDGQVKIHLSQLYIYGEDAMKAMFTSEFAELQNKKILLKNFSLKTVKAFVDFLYLGPQGVTYKMISDNEVDLNELFAFADLYQISSLIDLCAHLFSLFARPEDAKNINDLAQNYNNEYLKRLGEHLLKQSLATSISNDTANT